MADKTTYIRPLQYDNELRIFSVILGAESCSIVGSGFDDDAQAFVSINNQLQQLKVRAISREQSDILVCDAISYTPPFNVFVVNPSRDGGQASNAITFQYYSATAIADVVVNGKSVVKNNVAVLNLTSMLVTTDSPNKIYGTDDKGAQTFYDLAALKGIQQVQVGGVSLPVDSDGKVNIVDMAMESKTVQKSSETSSVYGTDASGNQVVIAMSTIAKQADVDSINSAIAVINRTLSKKQSTDDSATNGDLAVFSNGQTVSSKKSLSSITGAISKNADDISSFNDKVTEIANKKVDWKSSDEGSITNSPLHANSIVMTTYDVAKESAIAAANAGYVNVLAGDSSTTSASTAVGSNVNASGSVAIGKTVSAKNGVSVGDSSSSDASVSIGHRTSSSSNSVALGNDSKTNDINQVSFGDAATGLRRRLSNVSAPTDDFDAVNKKYIDSLSGDMAVAVDNVTIKGSGKIGDPLRSVIGTTVGTFTLARSPFKVREVRTEAGTGIHTAWLGLAGDSRSEGTTDTVLSTLTDSHYVYSIYLNSPENDANVFLNPESDKCIWGRVEVTEKAPGFVEYDILQDEQGNERHVCRTSSFGGVSGYKHSISLGDGSAASKENELSIGRGLEEYEVDASVPMSTRWTGTPNNSASILSVEYEMI